MNQEFEQLELCLSFDCEEAPSGYTCDWSELLRLPDEPAHNPTHPCQERSAHNDTDWTRLAEQVLTTLEQSG